MNKLIRRFYSLCTADAPPPFLRGGGARTQARFLFVKRIKMIRKPLNVSHLRLSPKASNKNHTGIIKTLVGLHSHPTFVHFVSVYVSNLTDYVKVKMDMRPSLLDSC